MKKTLHPLAFASLAVPALSVIFILFDYYFPVLTALFLKCAFLSLPYLAFFFISPLARKITLPLAIEHKKSASLLLLIIIMLIQISVCALFLGQIYTIGQYELRANHLVSMNIDAWFWQFAWELFSNLGLFPWAMIAVSVVFFYLSYKQHQGRNSLAAGLRFSPTLLGRLLSRMMDLYLIASNRILFAVIVACIGLQLSQLIYPTFSAFLFPILGIVIASALLIITDLKTTKRVFSLLKTKNASLALFFALQILFITLISIAASLLGRHLLNTSPQHILFFSPIAFFSQSKLPVLNLIWFLSWWILCAPTLGSLFFKISQGHKLIKVIAFLFVLPVIVLIAWNHFKYGVIALSISPTVIYSLQGIGLLGMLLLFKENFSQDLLWYGFIPPHLPKKIHRVDLKTLWVLPPIMIALLSLGGLPILQALLVILSIPLVGIYIGLMLRFRINPET